MSSLQMNKPEEEEAEEEPERLMEAGAGMPPPEESDNEEDDEDPAQIGITEEDDDDDDDDDDAAAASTYENSPFLAQPSQQPPPPRFLMQQPTGVTIRNAFERFQSPGMPPFRHGLPPMPPLRQQQLAGALAPHANINVNYDVNYARALSPMQHQQGMSQEVGMSQASREPTNTGDKRGGGGHKKTSKNKAKKPSKKKASGSGGGGGGGAGGGGDDKKTSARFTEEEVTTLIDIISTILPIGNVLWEQVELDFNTNFPDRQRNLDNLRRQFNRQVKRKAPTGDPNIPGYVLKAKDAQRQIVRKADAQVLNGEDGEEDLELIEIVGRPVAEAHAKEMRDRRAAATAATGTAAASSAKKKTSGSYSSDEDEPKTRKKKKDQASSTDGILQAFLAVEASRREAQERRDIKEEERDRRQQEKDDSRLEMLMGFMATAVQAFGGNNKGNGLAFRPKKRPTVDSDSDDTTLSTASFERHCDRWRRMNKRRRRRRSNYKKPVELVEVGDSHGYKTGDSDEETKDKKPAAK